MQEVQNMSAEKIMEIIMEQLVQAERDLQECRRGSNFGRVDALKKLVDAIEKAEKNN